MPQTIMISERGKTPPTLWSRISESIRSYTVGPISVRDPALAKLFGAGYRTTAGVVVTDENALTFSAVYDAVSQSSGDLAKLPLELLIRRQGGGSQPFTASKTYRLLKDEANPDMSAFVLRRTLQAHALLFKGGFAEIERNGAGQPMALWIIEPDRIEPLIQKTTLPNGRVRTTLKYRVDGDNRNLLNSADVIHVHGLGYDGYCAYPVIDKARQTIGIALAAQNFSGAFFGNNSNFGGIITAEGLDEEQASAIQDRIEKTHKGAEKAWHLLVLGLNAKYNRTGITPQESQMDATARRQVEDVARFFNFPLHKLKNLDRATNNNIEHQDLEYYKGHQLTWITAWEQEFNRKLISPLERSQQYFKHNATAVMRADAVGRTALYAALLDRGVFCADDVLELEDRNPQPNGQGQMFLVQGAMVPKDKLGALADATIKKAEAKAQPSIAPTPPVPTKAEDDGRALAEAIARADSAERAAEEARAAVQEERERRIALEATGTATAEQLAEARTSERNASTLATNLTANFEQQRSDLASAQAAAAAHRAETVAAEERAAVLAGELETARTAVQAAQEEVALAVAGQGAAEAHARSRETALAEAQAAVVIAEQRMAEATTATGTDREAREAAAIARAEAELALRDARAELQASETRHREAVQSIATSQDALGAARAAAAVLEQQAAEAEAHRVRDAEALAAGATRRAELEAEVARLHLVETEHAAFERAHAESVAQEQASRAEQIRQFEDSRDADRAALTASETRRSDLEATILRLTAEAATAETTATVDRARTADLERHVAEATEQVQALTSRLAEVCGSHDASLQPLRSALTTLETALAEARDATARHEAEAQTRAGTIGQLEAELRTVRQADTDAMGATIAAHRELVLDIMRRMVERETDRARRAQQTPEKLRAFLDSFYEAHADLMRTALLPAIRVHLAFIRSSEDPLEATRRLVDTHVRQSQQQLRDVLTDVGESYAASVPALLYRWDSERPTTISDALMKKELDYARRL